MIYNRHIKYPSIIQYVIYGERHSGTNFLEGLLNNTLTIPRTWAYGDKHWFGYANSKSLILAPRTLFICIVRNPYDWINGFYLNPYHIPSKNIISLKHFILNEWYSINPQGEEIFYDRNYMFNTRYKNIFELRKYKLYYLRTLLPNIVDNYVFIRYEDLMIKPIEILNNIIDYYSLQYQSNYSSKINVEIKHPYKTRNDLLEILNNNIDWTIEKTAGYFMQSVLERGYS